MIIMTVAVTVSRLAVVTVAVAVMTVAVIVVTVMIMVVFSCRFRKHCQTAESA